MLKLIIKNDKDFYKAGKTGVTQLKSGKKNLWNASLYALAHYAKCGDHSKLNDSLNFHLDAGVGAHQLKIWIETFSDQIYDREQKKFVRDEENKDPKFANVEAASMENYWIGVQRQDQDALEFNSDTLNKELNKVLGKFSKRKAVDASATETLEYWKRLVNAKDPSIKLTTA